MLITMTIQEIYVESKERPDTRGQALMRELEENLGITGITDINVVDAYKLEGTSEVETTILQEKVFTDPVLEKSRLNIIPDGENSVQIEVAKKPGVMDPREESMRRVAGYFGITPIAVATSNIITIHGNVSVEDQEAIRSHIPNQLEHVIDATLKTLLVGSEAPPVDVIAITELAGQQLVELSNQRRLFLNATEMQVIQTYYQSIGREPTDVELEALAQTWSEHNVHKTFKAKLVTPDGQEKDSLMSRIKKTSEKYYRRVGIVSAFADNSGIIDLGDGEHGIAMKGETHNSPVAIEPFGGSATKNGGVYRDIAGTGKVGWNRFGIMVNCLASPYLPTEQVPKGSLHPKHILLENSRGEQDYGNKMGIPTLGLNLHFKDSFRVKPTSMGIAIGIIPLERAQKGEPQAGDILLTVGGKTGRDGIHGATFSSGEMTAETKRVDGTAVQIGNPIEQKRMFDALEKCGEANLIRAITDCGGGGYSSAIGEIAADVGVTVHLDKVPLKYQGLASWEKWLSEAQERMVLAVFPDKLEEFKQICKIYEVPVDAIGEFTGDQTLRLMENEEVVGLLPMDFLHNGLPQRTMKLRYKEREEKKAIPEEPKNWQVAFEQVIGHLTICSKEPMLRQYDQTVKAGTILEPFTGVHHDAQNDATVVLAVPGKPYGIVAAVGLNPTLNDEDPYWGSIWAGTRAISNFTAHGGDPNRLAFVDNFVWPAPDEESLGDLDMSVDALCHVMDALQIPCDSGKDSVSSTYTRRGKNGQIEETIKISALLNITACGPIPDIRKTVSVDIKSLGSTLCLVGKMDTENLGASVYFETQGIENSHIPHVDLKSLPQTLQTIHQAIQTGEVKSCKAIGEGGLATALSIMCFGGDCGADIDAIAIGASRADYAFFNETAGCFVVEVPDADIARNLFGDACVLLGLTTEDKTIKLRSGGDEVANFNVDRLKEVWQKPMKEIYGN